MAMRKSISIALGIVVAMVVSVNILVPRSAVAASDVKIDREVDAALASLCAGSPQAKAFADRAKGILVFPRVFKAGIFFGGHYGEGSLRVGGATVGYYDTTAVSYGFQVGAQYYGYALFFMTDTDLNYLQQSSGWEIGVGPSIVVVDQGTASPMTSTTVQSGIYAFVFNQNGLMAGVGLQGSKISRFTP
jgi:lipid-binding SYLF domain-containing protein